jgi:hypothetical protein
MRESVENLSCVPLITQCQRIVLGAVDASQIAVAGLVLANWKRAGDVRQEGEL